MVAHNPRWEKLFPRFIQLQINLMLALAFAVALFCALLVAPVPVSVVLTIVGVVVAVQRACGDIDDTGGPRHRQAEPFDWFRTSSAEALAA